MTVRSDPGTGLRVPDFFIVGHSKSGTTALYRMLGQHPGIFMPALKEPLYLAADMRPRFSRAGKGFPISGTGEYLRLFAEAAPDQRLGEATSVYLPSRTAAKAIAQLNPDARIIAIFREPTDFLHSLHLQHRQDLQETKRTLREALAVESARRSGHGVPKRCYRPQDLLYSEHVRYTEQLQRYHAVFPRSQVLVVIHDDFRRDNLATVRHVLALVGADPEWPVVAEDANESVSVRSQALDDAVHRFSVGRGPLSTAVKASLKTVMGRSARRRLLSRVRSDVVRGRAPEADPELQRELRRVFKPEVERFSQYLGRDLVALWGYGDA